MITLQRNDRIPPTSHVPLIGVFSDSVYTHLERLYATSEENGNLKIEIDIC